MSAGPVAWVDTSLRDLAAHPWGSGIGAEDLAVAAAALARTGAVVLEALDARSVRGALDGRSESPWDRLRAIARVAGSLPLGIVVPAGTLWGERPLGDDLARRLVFVAVESGAGRIRSVDPLNHAERLAPVAAAAAEAEVAFVPTIGVAPAPEPGHPEWVREAERMASLPGASAICITDNAGLLRPDQLADLVRTVGAATGLPIEVSLIAPGDLASVCAMASVEAGATAVQAAVGAVAVASARPSAETLRAALAGGPHDTAVDRTALHEAASLCWSMIPAERLRQAAVVAAGPALGLPLDLATGLASRLARLGLGGQLIEAADEAARVAHEAGDVTLTLPVGEAVVAQAARHVIEGRRWAEVEPVLAATILGVNGPPRGPVAPEALAAAGATPASRPPPAPDLAAVADDAPGELSEEDLLLWAMFPEATARLVERRRSVVGEASDAVSPSAVDRALIETLVDVVEQAGEAEVSVEVGGARVTVRRSAPMAVPAGDGAAAAAAQGPADGLARVESPMVGTFYRAPSPTADAFVAEGDRVSAGQTLCIIEAMKIFNEIVTEQGGVVREICAENAEPVEYGQLLFLIEP
ncbi:MAG TPA: biotin/lipoyl-containing protein [Miltoncostaeaceae bacterium]|nr:biotin/lipoyl-containing protein [Miltoncostaeaceae bacterium]